MSIFSRMVNTQAMLFLFILLGIVVRKSGIITRENRQGFNRFLIRITLPAMILSAFIKEGELTQLNKAGLIILISAGSTLFAYLLGRVLWRSQPSNRRSTLVFATMFSNAGNAGLPVVSLVFGQNGLFFASLFLIPVRVLMWTLGVGLFLADQEKGKWKKLLLTPSVAVVFIGFFILVLNVKLPDVLAEAIKRVGNITGPLSMILIGTTLAEIPFLQAFCKEAWLLSSLRLIVIPLLTLGVLLAIKADHLVTQIAFVLCAMPAATTTVVLAEQHGADYYLASRCVFMSTILSLLTVPLLTLLI